jgi:hypothetical protein
MSRLSSYAGPPGEPFAIDPAESVDVRDVALYVEPSRTRREFGERSIERIQVKSLLPNGVLPESYW